MHERTYLIVSGAVFAVLTAGHAARLIYRVPVRIGPFDVPGWPSILVVIVALLLCVWAFRLLRASRQA